jgi:hypothetical protein
LIRYSGVEYLYYLDKYSTKGVHIELTHKGYAIRNTVFSNKADMLLTNTLSTILSNLLKTPILNEEELPLIGKSIFQPEEIENLMMRDAQSIITLSEHVEDLTLFGPLEMVHFGKNTAQKLSLLKNNPQQLVTHLEALFLKVNYELPFTTLKPTLEIKTKSGQKWIAANYIPSENWVLKKYDLLCLPNSDEIVFITNKNLNSILPPNWELIDEFTIVAPMLSDLEFQELLQNAKKLKEKI